MKTLPLLLLFAGLTLTLRTSQSIALSGRIDGVVLEAGTDRPLPAVSVHIAGRQIVTDNSGRFEFDGLPAGRQTLFTEKDNYTAARLDAVRNFATSGIELVLQPRQPIHDLVLRAFPAGVVTGRITDGAGKPIRNTSIAVFRYVYNDEGRKVLSWVGGNSDPIYNGSGSSLPRIQFTNHFPAVVKVGKSDDRGDFRIYNLEPGPYVFYVTPPLPYVATYYPGIADLNRAEMVDVEGGRETHLQNVTLFTDNFASLFVNSTQTRTSPGFFGIPGVEVRRKGDPNVLAVQSSVGPAGRPFVRLPPGIYEVEVFAVTEGKPPLSVASSRAEVTMSGIDVTLNMNIGNGTAVKGTVTAQSATGVLRPVAGVQLALESDDILPGASIPLVSAADGSFSAALPLGVFRVKSVSGIPTDMCVVGIRDGSRNVLRDGLMVQGPQASFSIAITESQGSVRGKVNVPNSIVAMIPDDRAQTELFMHTTADQNGEFQFPCLTPGAYHLYAWPALTGAAYRNADFMKPFNSRGQEVHVGNGEHMSVDVSALEP